MEKDGTNEAKCSDKKTCFLKILQCIQKRERGGNTENKV